jgi:hypothetical protein
MSFRSYVHQSRVHDNPQGDFKCDARMDSTFPDATSWKELEAYLNAKGAAPAAIDAGKKVWTAYRAKKRQVL